MGEGIMSSRQLASPKQRRGEITTLEAVARVFSHLKKDKPEPAHPTKNPWTLKPFKGIIRGNKTKAVYNITLKLKYETGCNTRIT